MSSFKIFVEKISIKLYQVRPFILTESSRKSAEIGGAFHGTKGWNLPKTISDIFHTIASRH